MIYEAVGAKRVLNAMGIYTDLGGSMLSPRVLGAMEEANRWFVSIPDLLEASGRLIAGLVGSEHARVTPGASASLTLGTAACLTRGEPEAVGRLPETDGVILIQRGHRYKYDRCLRVAGARLVEVEEADLAGGLADAPAALAFPAHLDGLPGTVGLAEAIELAHTAGVPVLVDAAFQVDPPERLQELAATGADLICVSSKYYGGPNAGGFVFGKREWIDALAALDFVRFESGDEHHRFGRPFKLDRGTIVGVVEGLRAWLETDHEARWAGYGRQADALAARLGGLPGLELTPMCFTMQETLEPTPVNCLHIRAGARAGEIERSLREGDPSVRVHAIDDALVVVFETIPEEHEKLLGERLLAALREPVSE